MSDVKLHDIATGEGESISIPYGSHYSVGTSPYYAHQHALALDIYQNLFLKNYNVVSPVSGKIIVTKELGAPKPRFAGGIDKEYLLHVRSLKNPKIMFKILHIKSHLKEGDIINKGEFLGKTIKNGYFAQWSSPHIHIEIRKFGDVNRAKGGKNFNLTKSREIQINHKKNKKIKENTKPKVEVIHKLSQYILGKFSPGLYNRIGKIFGLNGYLKSKHFENKKNCERTRVIVDGGLPIYKRGIIIFPKNSRGIRNSDLYFLNAKIGEIKKTTEYFGFIDFTNVKMYLDNIKLRGISLFLSDKLPLIKFIPEKSNAFEKIQKTSLEFEIYSNT